MKEKVEQILLIAGCGQNVGKTTLACRILQNECEKKPVAVKITPHFHKTTAGLVEIENGENWALFEETDKTSTKDSSLYLQNGAAKSYLIQAIDSGLERAFLSIKNILPGNTPFVVESAALINFIQPGLFVVVLPENECEKKETLRITELADLIVISNGKKFSPSPSKIAFGKTWKLK